MTLSHQATNETKTYFEVTIIVFPEISKPYNMNGDLITNMRFFEEFMQPINILATASGLN